VRSGIGNLKPSSKHSLQEFLLEAERIVTNTPEEDFGCEQCWPPDADAAWKARRSLMPADPLIDESHFRAVILVCPHCTQQFLSVFTETIDWADGDDPQYWTLLPVTKTEASGLTRFRNEITESKLNALGPVRRSLRRDYPKNCTEPCVYWGRGISIGYHD
jgi:hypothetical protein